MALNVSLLSNASQGLLTLGVLSTTMATLGILNETLGVTTLNQPNLIPVENHSDHNASPIAGSLPNAFNNNISNTNNRNDVMSSSFPGLDLSSTSLDHPSYLCDGSWLPVNHLYFQLANLFLFLSYLAPNGVYGILYLRVTLCIGCFFFSLWGWVVLCAFDTFLWNAVFVLINLGHVAAISYGLRPVRFSAELEQVYRELFAPLKVSRPQYKRALDCMKLIRHVRFQEIFAQEKITRVDSLSLVLSGRLVISQHGRALHIVAQHQFLDSPEWFGVSSDEFFQVSATAIEDSRVLIWHRDKLKLSISSDPFLVSVFDHILGRDVVKKLMQMNETLSSQPASNGQCGGATPSKPPAGVLTGAAAAAAMQQQQQQQQDTAAAAVAVATEDSNFSSGCTSESKPLLVAITKQPGEDSSSTTSSITSILTRQIAELNSPSPRHSSEEEGHPLVESPSSPAPEIC